MIFREQSVDIRADTTPMTKEAARNLLKTHWTATGKIQSMNDEQFGNFSECFPTVDLRSGFTMVHSLLSIVN